VADAMTGQEAVNVAKGFHERVGLTGLILTKVDGDARWRCSDLHARGDRRTDQIPRCRRETRRAGAVPPRQVGDAHPGNGRRARLIERAGETMDRGEAERMGRKLVKGEFNLEDFLKQLQQIKKMGPLTQLLDMIPGMGRITSEIAPR